MLRKMLNRDQIREEVQQRLLLSGDSLSGMAKVSVPMPKPHSLDVQARNWDMKELGQPEGDAYVRQVVDQARKEFLLSDARERDEILGNSFAHR
ncbi:hypothetical protein [Paraburkholderia fungorum]|uniref:hypothetical protein n=1 Tax=Paraburkholderia fungorum TaxID=134537 RepID=UPI0038B7A484